jgi:hypothetical protein
MWSLFSFFSILFFLMSVLLLARDILMLRWLVMDVWKHKNWNETNNPSQRNGKSDGSFV